MLLLYCKCMHVQTILVASADYEEASVIVECLDSAGYRVLLTDSGSGVSSIVNAERPDLLLLEWGLPDLSSLAVIRVLRADLSVAKTPIMLRGIAMREEDILLGLEAGADLCLREPFHPKVIVARVQSLLRRYQNSCPV
jgi:DNA-binding response OmpR family regulator